jgi:metal-responsive CopG/Arc/MetJ family transcriptional regulator
MAEQLKHVQKKENRSRSELMREAWRHYFESHYAGYTPSHAEIAAIRTGRAEISRGNTRRFRSFVVTWTIHIVEASRKADRKGSL